jgi:hypothetical protein
MPYKAENIANLTAADKEEVARWLNTHETTASRGITVKCQKCGKTHRLSGCD